MVRCMLLSDTMRCTPPGELASVGTVRSASVVVGQDGAIVLSMSMANVRVLRRGAE